MKEFETYFNKTSNELDELTSKILTTDDNLSKIAVAVFVELSNHLKQFLTLGKDCLNEDVKNLLDDIYTKAKEQFEQNFLEIKMLLDGNKPVTVFYTATLSNADVKNKTDNYNQNLAVLFDQVTNETNNQIRDKLLKAVSDFRTAISDVNQNVD